MRRVLAAVLIASLLAVAGCELLAPPAEAPAAQPPAPTAPAPAPPAAPAPAPPPAPVGGPALPSIAAAVEVTYPSVVTITTEAIFGGFFGTQVQTGAGSGWVYSQDGVIVTNNHVVEGASRVIVGLADGKTFQADRIYRDPITDLAVVKISATGLPAARVGDPSRLRLGDWVVAIGNPLGQGMRIKEGTISGLQVTLALGEGESLYDLIETSAAINPGNSGGPLVNMAGEVIGITSAKIATVGVEGMGYAISTKTALPIIEQLVERGYVTRPWLGAELVTVNRYVAAINRLPVDRGAVISEVVRNSPASRAGLRTRDVIIRFQGQDVTSAEAMVQSIHNSQIGQEVEIVFVRNTETRTVRVTLAESPPP